MNPARLHALYNAYLLPAHRSVDAGTARIDAAAADHRSLSAYFSDGA